jgi:chaperone modulatory protein CbpM
MANETPLRGQLIEEETVVTLEELCGACTVRSEEVVTLVREGVIDPVEGPLRVEEAPAWRFHITSVWRVRTAVRLQRDLGVNLAGAALALELLDRIAELERDR